MQPHPFSNCSHEKCVDSELNDILYNIRQCHGNVRAVGDRSLIGKCHRGEIVILKWFYNRPTELNSNNQWKYCTVDTTLCGLVFDILVLYDRVQTMTSL